MHAAALALALLALLAVGPAPAAAALVSQLWGVNGELYNPAGRLLDFSFAGACQAAQLACLGLAAAAAQRCRPAATVAVAAAAACRLPSGRSAAAHAPRHALRVRP